MPVIFGPSSDKGGEVYLIDLSVGCTTPDAQGQHCKSDARFLVAR